jgi:hypothetical protein
MLWSFMIIFTYDAFTLDVKSYIFRENLDGILGGT